MKPLYKREKAVIIKNERGACNKGGGKVMAELYILGAAIIVLAYVTIPFTYRLINDRILHPTISEHSKGGYVKVHHSK